MSLSERADTIKSGRGCIEAPILKRVCIQDFIEFKHQPEIYYNQINEKERQLKEDIVPTSYRASIEDDDLTTCIDAGWINASSINEITEA